MFVAIDVVMMWIPSKYRLWIVLLLFLSASSNGQNALFRVSLDNDVLNFTDQTDRYYSNGLNIGFYHPQLNNSILNHLLFGNDHQSIQSTGITFHQGIYTPIDLRTTEVQRFDRPYAATALLSQERIAVNPIANYKITSSVGVGVIGKFAGGELSQNFIHSLTENSDRVNGWDHQIANDFIVDYRVKVEKGIVDLPFAQLHLVARSEIGTLRNVAMGGANFSIGLLDPFYASPFGRNTQNEFTFRFFGGINYGYLFYDATLQGGVFTQSEHVIEAKNIQNQRLNYSYGVQLNYKNAQVEFGKEWQNAEFNGAKNHAWGYLKFSWFLSTH